MWLDIPGQINSFFGEILRWHHSPFFCWKERHEELGECVGYRIGGDSVVGKRLNFQTTGWLLRPGFLECWIWWRDGFSSTSLMVSFLFWGSVALQGLWYPPGTITYPGPTERDKEQKNSTQEYRLGKGYVDRSQESVVFLFRKEFFFSYLKQQNSSKFHQGHVSTKPWKVSTKPGPRCFLYIL